MNESSPQRQLVQCWLAAWVVFDMDSAMSRIGDACSNRPVYFYVAVPGGYSESWSQLTFSNPERLFMSTAATSAPCQQGAICHRALVNYYWTNLPLVLLTLAQALGAPVGRPTIRKGLPSTGHLQHEPWLARKVLHTEVTAAGLICPLAMGRRPNSLILDAVGNRPLLSAWPAGHSS